MLRNFILLLAASFAVDAQAAERHYIYAASPGVRNYIEYGGVGLVVFDADNG